MKDVFEHILLTIVGFAIIFLSTWIIFGVYLGLPIYNVCYWFMLVVTGLSIYGWIKG